MEFCFWYWGKSGHRLYCKLSVSKFYFISLLGSTGMRNSAYVCCNLNVLYNFGLRQGDKNIYNPCMYKFSGIVSLCSQGKFLNMITRLEDILKWIHVHVYINFSFIDHLLYNVVLIIKSTSMYSLCSYDTTHA